MEANETLRKVIKARSEGWTWDDIANVLCMATAEQAEYVYGSAVAAHEAQISDAGHPVWNLS